MYDGPVSESYNEVRLRPMHDDRQSCLSFRLITNPESRGTAYRDSFGNWVHQFNILKEHRASESKPSPSSSRTKPSEQPSPIRPRLPTRAAPRRILRGIFRLHGAQPVRSTSSSTRGNHSQPPSNRRRHGLAFAQAASDLIHERFRYVKGATHVHSSIVDSLTRGRRRLPGFRASVARSRPHARASRRVTFPAIWSPAAPPTERQAGRSHRRPGIARVGRSFRSRRGWVGFDPTLGKSRRSSPCPHRLRPRLRRRRSRSRRIQRSRRPATFRRRPRPPRPR